MFISWPVTGVRANGNPGISPSQSDQLAAYDLTRPSQAGSLAVANWTRRGPPFLAAGSQQRSNTRNCGDRIGTSSNRRSTMDNFNFTVVKRTTAYFEWIKGSSWRSARWSVKGTRATVVYCKRNLNSFSDIFLVVFQFSSKDCKRALV